MSTLDQDLFLVEIVAIDPDTSLPTTLYFGTAGFITTPSETPASQVFQARVKQAVQMQRTLFGASTTRGRSTIGFGDIVINNSDGVLDAYLDSGFDGQVVTVRRGTLGAAYPSGFTTELVATMGKPVATQTEITIKLRDRQAETSVPLQTTKYAGSGLGTLEGTADSIQGKPKPVCYGTVLNVTPPCVETAKLIYQIADAQMTSVDGVYDRGVSLTVGYLPLYVGVGVDTGTFPPGFVAGIQSSADSATWASRSGSPAGGGAASAARLGLGYGAGTWVSVGQSGFLDTSTNATSWTSRTSGLGGQDIWAAAYGQSKWIIAGGNGLMSVSTDNGVTWTKLTSLPFGSTTIRALIYAADGGGLWVAAAGTTIGYSPDGVNWKTATASSMTAVYGLTFGNGVYVAVGENAGVPAINTSTDCSSWTSRTVPASHTTTKYLGVTYGNSTYVVVGVNSTPNGIIASSSNATTWTARTPASAGAQFNGVTYGATFVLCGGTAAADGVIQTSSDGITWTDRTEAFAQGIYAVKYGEGVTVDTYANTTDLLDNTKAPAAGKYKMYLGASGSYFRLGSAPTGLVTCDATAAANAFCTAAQIYKQLLEDRAGLSGSDYNSSDLTDLDTDSGSAQTGFWTDAETTIAPVLDQVLGSVGASWYVDRTGIFRTKQLKAPSGSPVVSFTKNGVEGLQQVACDDAGQGLPAYSCILRYQQNYTVQTSDVATSVTAARKAFLAKQWREASDNDATVQDVHALAVQLVEDSLLASSAAAATEVTRRLTLRKSRRELYQFRAPYDATNRTVELGDVVQLTHDSFGLTGGALFRVLAIAPNARDKKITFTVWGAP